MVSTLLAERPEHHEMHHSHVILPGILAWLFKTFGSMMRSRKGSACQDREQEKLTHTHLKQWLTAGIKHGSSAHTTLVHMR